MLVRLSCLKNRTQEAKEIIYSLRKQKYHAEPLFAENIFSDEEMLKTIITEGISLKHNKIFKKSKPLLIFSYSLENLDNVKKVQFNHASYGRKKDGLIYESNGLVLGKGCFAAPVETEHIFRELFMKFDIKFKVRKMLSLN